MNWENGGATGSRHQFSWWIKFQTGGFSMWQQGVVKEKVWANLTSFPVLADLCPNWNSNMWPTYLTRWLWKCGTRLNSFIRLNSFPRYKIWLKYEGLLPSMGQEMETWVPHHSRGDSNLKNELILWKTKFRGQVWKNRRPRKPTARGRRERRTSKG